MKSKSKPRRNSEVGRDEERKKGRSPMGGKPRIKIMEKNKRQFEMKKTPSLKDLLLVKAQSAKNLSKKAVEQVDIDKAIQSGRKLMKNHQERKVVLTHLTAIINAPPPHHHSRKISQDSAASSGFSCSMNSPHEEQSPL